MAASMSNARQNLPTIPGLVSGSPCRLASRSTTVVSFSLIGHRLASRHAPPAPYSASTLSGSRIGPSCSRNTYSPSSGQLGQYISRSGW